MRFLITGLVGLALSVNSQAAQADAQADSFSNIYASTCLKHLSDLEALRRKLKNAPELPPDKAAMFLQGNPGNAWPVPDKNGVFVVALPKDKNICFVYARRVNSQAAEDLFIKIVEKSPDPLTARKVKDTSERSTKNGQTRTLSYEWSVPQAPRKTLFTLTTATSETADLQGMASAAYVK